MFNYDFLLSRRMSREKELQLHIPNNGVSQLCSICFRLHSRSCDLAYCVARPSMYRPQSYGEPPISMDSEDLQPFWYTFSTTSCGHIHGRVAR